MTIVYGYELVVGDAIEWLGTDYQITSFEEHPGLNDSDLRFHPARVAVSEPDDRELFVPWRCTVFDNDTYKVEVGTRPGERVVRLHN